MNFFKILTLTTAIAGASLASAEVRELDRLAGLRTEVDAETLLIFDLDNTLIEPVQTLGSDQWFGYLVKQHEARGVPHLEAVDLAIALWSRVQERTLVRAVETTSAAEVTDYQRAGIRVMGLTARPEALADTTIRQLRSVGIDLSRTAGLPDGLALTGNGVSGLARGGIVFSGPNNDKGKVLLNYLRELKISPKKIVFVDDKANNVRNVDAALAPAGVPYLGLRYGGADARVKAFDPRLAEIELKYFLEIMDDDTAGALRGPANETKFRAASFNIRWYGIGGKETGTPADEKRDATLRQFMDRELSGLDLAVFEEIVDVPRFLRELAPSGMNCVSYERPVETHQHVVLCLAPQYRLEKEAGDDNFLIDEVALDGTKSRPAVSGLVVDGRTGRGLIHVVGVHLKAQDNETDKRLYQASVIADRLQSYRDGLPSIVLGDFNTHVAAKTGREKDDDLLIDDLFRAKNLGLVQLTNPSAFTYRTKTLAAKLDHMWFSGQAVRAMSAPRVAGPCNIDASAPDAESVLSEYYKTVSDHCPVIVELGVAN